MTSFQITVSPSRRAAARFIAHVRRELQKALVTAASRSGISQSDVARTIGVHRSVINRELRGQKDISLGRVAELAQALGYKPIFKLEEVVLPAGSNLPPWQPAIKTSAVTSTKEIEISTGATTFVTNKAA